MGTWRQDTGERIAKLETHGKDISGNGQQGRMTTLEGHVRKIERIRWYVGGAALVSWGGIQATAQWLIDHK